MTITIPASNQWMSPVFDVAGKLLVVEIQHGREMRRTEAFLDQPGATSRLQRLAEVGMFQNRSKGFEEPPRSLRHSKRFVLNAEAEFPFLAHCGCSLLPLIRV